MDTTEGKQWALEVLQEARDRILALLDRNKGEVMLGLFGALTHLGVLSDEVRHDFWKPNGQASLSQVFTTWYLVLVVRRIDKHFTYTVFRDSDAQELERKLREIWYPEAEYDLTVSELPGSIDRHSVTFAVREG